MKTIQNEIALFHSRTSAWRPRGHVMFPMLGGANKAEIIRVLHWWIGYVATYEYTETMMAEMSEVDTKAAGKM